MAADPLEIIALIKDLYLFHGLSDAQLAKIATRADLQRVDEDHILFTEAQKDRRFFVVLAGRIGLSTSQNGVIVEDGIIKPGEFFGANDLLFDQEHWVTAKAQLPSQLLVIEPTALAQLGEEIPQFKVNLKDVYDFYRMTRRKFLQWLGPDEIVLLIRRKHIAYLGVAVLGPLLLAFAGLMVLLLGISFGNAAFSLIAQWLGIGILAFSGLFGLWQIMDWGNDYYIVTDQRVVWLERVIGLYDSRQEAPMVAIKSTEVKSTQLGRMLGYGSLVVQALMGEVSFREIPNPKEVKTVIDRYQSLAGKRVNEIDQSSMERVIRRKIDPAFASSAAAPAQAAAVKPTKPVVHRLRDYFKTRLVDGDTITYRKHWFNLLMRTWLPMFLEIAVISLTIWLVGQSSKPGGLHILTPTTLILLTLFLSVIFFLWWLYQFVDWHNDIYQVTADKILDSERKPLGDEKSKSAPLENIQSLNAERRGLLGIVLNFGNIIINVGTESRFIFFNIPNPAQAQRDIFQHMYDRNRRKELADTHQQWEQVSDWLAAYHRQVEEMRRAQNQSNLGSDSG